MSGDSADDAGRAGGATGGERNSIAVMNTKGGVGKSTLVLAMAETLSAKFAKNVLVIDAGGGRRRLRAPAQGHADNRCFAEAVPRTHALQHAAQLSAVERPYDAENPDDSATILRAVSQELLDRLAAANAGNAR